MKFSSLSILFVSVLCSCGGGSSSSTESQVTTPPAQSSVQETNSENTSVQSNADLSNKGIGPVKEISLGEIDQGMADEGKQLYQSYCLACHKVDEDFIGPSPKGILERRSPEWVMNMILNPEEMTAKDPIAKRLLEEANGVPMIGQGLTEEQARKILEYFRTI